jgi:hypothetical protein
LRQRARAGITGVRDEGVPSILNLFGIAAAVAIDTVE